MNTHDFTPYIDVTQEAGAMFFQAEIEGPVVMLNLLRFREVADYSANPELAPAEPISGAEAYQAYAENTLPLLIAEGGELIFLGRSSANLIGPVNERWDQVMMIRHASVDAFMSFTSNEAYLAGHGHRTAALEDSRLLPIIEG